MLATSQDAGKAGVLVSARSIVEDHERRNLLRHLTDRHACPDALHTLI